MLIAQTLTAIALTLLLSTTAAQASSLEGPELEAYDSHCPTGNYRAVWAENLPGILTGWVNLVCLNEDEQETSYWYVTPGGNVVSPDEAELPVYVRPMAETDTITAINDLNDDETITLWLDFKYDEPKVPSLEAYGYPAGSFGLGSSSAGGRGEPVEHYYELNGVEVTAAEYEEWNTLFITTSRAQQAERARLVLEQVHLSLYDLVDINQWHDWIDINEINNGNSDDPRWEFNTTLAITLTGEQSRALLQSSEELVYVSIYHEAQITTDGGGSITTDLPTELVDIAAQSQPTALTISGNTISWPDDGWYQVQLIGDDGIAEICNGGSYCEVPEGAAYLVINHTTGERFEDIFVPLVPVVDGVTVTGNTVSWPDDGWYQVQSADSYESVCEGTKFCDVEPGNYLVINHTTGERFDNIVVGISGGPITVAGNAISWPDDGWYQVQNAETYENVCNGGSGCEVPEGLYIVINHSSGERFENVLVSDAQPNPSAIEFQELIRGDLAFTEDLTFREPRFQVVRTNENLNNLYFRALVYPCEACDRAGLYVDFSLYTVVLVAHEIVGSGGYDINIESVVQENNRIRANVVKTYPGENCATDSALTGPFKLYQIVDIHDVVDFYEESLQDPPC